MDGTPGVSVVEIVPRDYQVACVEEARRLIAAKILRILLVCPTGGGKTTIAALVIRGAVAKGKRALFLAHRREIVAQAFWRLVESGVPEHEVGVVMGNGKISHPITRQPYSAVRPGAKVQVASVQTLANRSRPPADVVFVDEAHHAAAGTWAELVAYYRERGAVVVGLTATPERADGAGLDDLFDSLHVAATVEGLVGAGWLVAPRVKTTPRKVDLSGVKVRGGDYQLADLEAAVNTGALVGDIVEHWQRHAEGRTTVVFATGVEHSRSIVARFQAAGVVAEHLDGAMDTASRDAVLARLASGETTVVSNCAVLTEGWDLPRAKVCVLARPTKSLSLYLQMAGRVLRPWQGVEALVLDHAGCALEHGLPQDPREWSLAGKKGRKSRGGDGVPAVRECPECRECSPVTAKVCPCGYEWPTREAPLEVDGELVEAAAAIAKAKDEEAREAAARKNCNREVGRVVSKWMDEAHHLTRDEVFTAVNRALYGVFRKSRTKMGADELVEVRDYLRSGRFEAEFSPPAPPPKPATVEPPPPPRAPRVVRVETPVAPSLPTPHVEEEVETWAL